MKMLLCFPTARPALLEHCYLISIQASAFQLPVLSSLLFSILVVLCFFLFNHAVVFLVDSGRSGGDACVSSGL